MGTGAVLGPAGKVTWGETWGTRRSGLASLVGDRGPEVGASQVCEELSRILLE